MVYTSSLRSRQVYCEVKSEYWKHSITVKVAVLYALNGNNSARTVGLVLHNQLYSRGQVYENSFNNFVSFVSFHMYHRLLRIMKGNPASCQGFCNPFSPLQSSFNFMYFMYNLKRVYIYIYIYIEFYFNIIWNWEFVEKKIYNSNNFLIQNFDNLIFLPIYYLIAYYLRIQFPFS